MHYYGLHWRAQLRVAPTIKLTDEQESELRKLANSRRTSVLLAERAQIVLLAAQGLKNREIAALLGVGRVQVARWRERYLASGLQGIERDLPRGAPPVKVDVAKLERKPGSVCNYGGRHSPLSASRPLGGSRQTLALPNHLPSGIQQPVQQRRDQWDLDHARIHRDKAGQ